MCVANPDNKGMDGKNLVLRSCNQKAWQAFMAVKPEVAHGGRVRWRPARRRCPACRHRRHVGCHPHGSSHSAYALYSVVNGRFVEGADSHMMSAADHAAPTPRGRLFPLPAAPVKGSTTTRGTGRLATPAS